MKIFVLLLPLVLMGCDVPQPQIDPYKADQCLRQQFFEKCMQLLPKGPEKTVYNDWDEVVESCGNQAYYSSLRLREVIKKECM